MEFAYGYEFRGWKNEAKKLYLFETPLALSHLARATVDTSTLVENDLSLEMLDLKNKKLHLDKDDQCSTEFITKLANFYKDLFTICPEEDYELIKELENNLFKFYAQKAWGITWLEFFSFVSSLNSNAEQTIGFESFGNDANLSNLIDSGIKHKFLKSKTNSAQKEALFDFTTKYLPYLSKNASAYPNSYVSVKELLQELDILYDIKSTKDSKKTKTWKMFQSFKNMTYLKTSDKDDILGELIRRVETIAEEKGTTLEVKRLRQIVNKMLADVFLVRQDLPHAYLRLKCAVVKAHNYQKIKIIESTNNTKIYESSSSGKILEELLEIVPEKNISSGVEKWFSIERIPSLLIIFNLIFDLILDVIITDDFRDWETYLNDIPCNITVDASNAASQGTSLKAVCDYSLHYLNSMETNFTCHLTINDTSFERICGLFGNTSADYGHCLQLKESTMNMSSGCTLHQMNEHVAFGISVSILSLTQIFYILILCLHWQKFKILYLYMFGHCCLQKHQATSSRCSKQFLLMVLITPYLCILLPFVTKIFVVIIMSVSLFHKDRNERILHKLKISDSKYREKLEKCSYCCDCTNTTAHICIFCGRTVAERQDQEASNPEKMESSIEITAKDKSIEDFEENKAFLSTEKQETDNPTQNVESIERNLRELDRLDRFTTGTTENCFMPVHL